MMSSPRSADPLGVAAAPLRLTRPVRCIWRPFLPGDPPPSAAGIAPVAQGIAEASPLVVELWLPAPWPALPPLPFAQVAVFAPPTVLPSLPGGVVRVADLTPGETGVPVLHPGDGASAAAFLLSAQTARHLPAAAQAAKAAGVPVLSLPPLPFHLVGRLGPPLASPRELESLWRGEILPSLSSLRGVRFEIHDRFLLERFREAGLAVGPPPSDAGCQAGTALVYVGPGGELFPCPLWPVPLGILSGEWDAVWQGGARRSFLEELVPHRLCAGCPRWDGCFGGCPGAAVALGVDGVPDPLCPEAGRD